ncbi:MAG: hypothetical protein OEZ58_11040 [Gammaproteobacteria bacterium]|nr:hypothetical protein [Gammaproteobacteria bacterium]MDH5729518.1 hypothetical protein [Gammaproteobacteria bacterium]
MTDKICDSCGFEGKPVHDEYSSIILDVAAWGLSFLVAGITGIIPLVAFGPAFSLWHLFTFRSHRCPKCGNWEMHSKHQHFWQSH